MYLKFFPLVRSSLQILLSPWLLLPDFMKSLYRLSGPPFFFHFLASLSTPSSRSLLNQLLNSLTWTLTLFRFSWMEAPSSWPWLPLPEVLLSPSVSSSSVCLLSSSGFQLWPPPAPPAPVHCTFWRFAQFPIPRAHAEICHQHKGDPTHHTRPGWPEP